MESIPFVLGFEGIGLEDRPRVGGKGGSLGELWGAGMPVPPGFVVTTEAFEAVLAELERTAPFRERIAALAADDLDALTRLSAELRARLERATLPPELLEPLLTAYAALAEHGRPAAVAVRSSATAEDSATASFAGLQDTYLWVTGAEQVLNALRRCWGSLYSRESLSYRRRQGLPESGVAMAVVVQRMVDARTAGVMFTRSPTTGDRSVITIEGSWGLGSAVVSGEVTPDRWVLAKVTGEIQVREVSSKALEHIAAPAGGVEARAIEPERGAAPSLNDAELEALRTIGRALERRYGHAQDIEWAIERGSDRVLLLQSRPETVWSNREAAPLAQPAQNPLEHLLSVFGGRRGC